MRHVKQGTYPLATAIDAIYRGLCFWCSNYSNQEEQINAGALEEADRALEALGKERVTYRGVEIPPLNSK